MRRRVDRLLKKEYAAAQHIADALEKELAGGRQFRLYLVGEKAGEPQAVETDKVDFKAVGEAVKAIKQLEELKRSLTGTAADAAQRAVIEIPALEES